VLLFVLTLFGGRLVQLQGLDGPALASEAQRQRTATKTLPAHRGDIVDASNATLATTVDRPDLQVDQTLVGKYKKVVAGHEVVLGIPGAARELSAVLSLSQSVVTQRLTGRSKGAILARGVSPDVARKVLRLLIPGVDMVQASKRIYPSGKLAANVLGFVSTADGHAMEGIERALDGQLAGSAGWLRYERALDRAGTPIPTGYTQEQDPRPGRTVQLTLVQDLQWQAEQALAAVVRSTGAKSADAVIMDAKTFKVLALATAPTFDPNSYGTARAADLGNRPLLDAFEPGSTAKVITMAAALEEKVATPTTKVVVPPVLRRADHEFHDAEDHGTEHLTVAGVLAQSSNIGTILTGEQVPARTMDDYLHRFGVGSPTGVGLPESSGVLAPYQKWSDSQRYTVMFGQGMSMTALQATTVFATIANDGVRLQPQLVEGTRDADGTFHPQTRAPGVRAVSADTARQVRAMLENVVGRNGTAEKAAVPGYRVAGKTGTAQAVTDGAYTSSFIGMAPADDPALVVAVVLHQPTVGHFGGEVAAPVFQQLMTAALFERKVPPTGTKPDEIPLQWR